MSQTMRGADRRQFTESVNFPLILASGERVKQDRRGQTDRRRLGFISSQRLFAGLPYAVLEPLVEGCEIRQLDWGNVLLTPGEPNHNLYLLLDGQLKVHVDDVDSARGFSITPGEFTGEVSIVDGKPATAFVVATEPTRVLVVPETTLWHDFLKDPLINKNFMRLFAERFRARNRALQEAFEQELRYEQLKKELDNAHDIQMGMLPQDLDLGPEIDLAAESTPAEEVGGDFYDVFRVSGDEDCIAVGDVAGKGMPAALFMARTMTSLRAELLREQPLEEALRRLNATLCEENPTRMFVSLLVGVLNRRTGDFRYVSAGHHPLVYGERGAAYRLLPSPDGMPAGMDEKGTYNVGSLTLAKDDVLVMYTDGVAKAKNRDGESFGSERLLQCLAKKPARSAWDLADRVGVAVQAFTAGLPPADDLTMVVVRYQGR
jgi:sigma-B regulation protein RsbU (phosphoserine phosphatase)